MPRIRKDLSFRIFGKWIVIDEADPRTNASGVVFYWLCQCECGNQREVSQFNLLHARSRQCKSCANKEKNLCRDYKNMAKWKNEARLGTFLDSMDEVMLKPALGGGYEFICRVNEDSECVMYNGETASEAIRNAIKEIHAK